VNRDNPTNDSSTPHPLSFTFKTDKPVYPMRLTGVGNGPVRVELYVFGRAKATAPHFKTERCVQPNYPEPPSGDGFGDWFRSAPETPAIVHPLLRKWVAGSRVATKLVGTLSPSDMREDVWLDWTSFSEKKNHVFSRAGALTTALNWGAATFVVGLLAGWVLLVRDEMGKRKFLRAVGMITLTSLGLAGLIYVSLPKIQVRMVRGFPGIESQNALFYLHIWLQDTNTVSLPVIQAEARRVLSNPADDRLWRQDAASMMRTRDNNVLGGRIHEEDSPGNYKIRENAGRLEFVAYDALGAEHIWVMEE
jgi:hypothetical protein